jgi:hypothetical protein
MQTTWLTLSRFSITLKKILLEMKYGKFPMIAMGVSRSSKENCRKSAEMNLSLLFG